MKVKVHLIIYKGPQQCFTKLFSSKSESNIHNGLHGGRGDLSDVCLKLFSMGSQERGRHCSQIQFSMQLFSIQLFSYFSMAMFSDSFLQTISNILPASSRHHRSYDYYQYNHMTSFKREKSNNLIIRIS